MRDEGLGDGADGLVELMLDIDISVEDGVAIERYQRIFYYGDESAVANRHINTIAWNPQQEDIRVLTATVLQPDQTQNKYDPSTVQINDTDSFDVFTDTREIIIIPPKLGVGSIAILSYERKINLEQPYFFSSYIQSTSRRKNFSLRVKATGTLPRWKVDGELLTCTHDNNSLNCSAEEILPVTLDDTVYYQDVAPQITISSFNDWQQVVKIMNERIARAMENSQRIENLFAEMSNESDYKRAAHDFVTRQVRYVSLSQGDNATFPHHVDVTIENRYGDCKDKSTLLLALLKAKNQKAYPVLVSLERSDPNRLVLPGMGYFDHMVICTSSLRGEHCYDATDTYTDHTTIPDGIQGKVRLNLVDGSGPSTIPRNEFRWRMHADAETVFEIDGSQTESLIRTYYGEYASFRRSQIESKSEQEKSEALVSEYQSTVSDKAQVSITKIEASPLNNELKISSETRFDPFFNTDEEVSYADNPFWVLVALGSFDIKNKYYDYDFPGLKLSSAYSYKLSDNLKLRDVGAEFNYATKYGEISRTYRSTGSSVTASTQLKMPAQIIAVDEKEGFNRFVQHVFNDSKIRFRMMPK
ncbi:MAG: DUF3857 domain-containing protein [Pseudomonadota bacterium]